VNESWN
jgi:hypothetical protein